MNRLKRTMTNPGNDKAGMIRAIGLEDLYHPSDHAFSRFAAGSIRSDDGNRRVRSSDIRVLNR